MGDFVEWADYQRELGRRLYALRRARGLSQRQLAQRSGVSRNCISRLESYPRAATLPRFGGHDPQLSTVYRLAWALEVAPVAVLPGAQSLVLEHCARHAEQTAD